jgi:hypothetical protein
MAQRHHNQLLEIMGHMESLERWRDALARGNTANSNRMKRFG